MSNTEPWEPATAPTGQQTSSGPAGPVPYLRDAPPVAESRGARVLIWVIAFALGALFGAIGTTVSQTSFSFFGAFSVPIGAIVATLAVSFLLVGLRLVLPSRVTALVAAIGVVAAVAVLSLGGAAGSILFPNNAAGVYWTLAPTVIGLVVVAWPSMAALSGRNRH
jgi:hypothetical protein